MTLTQDISYSKKAIEELNNIGGKSESKKLLSNFPNKPSHNVSAIRANVTSFTATNNKISRIGGHAFVLGSHTNAVINDNEISDIAGDVVHVRGIENDDLHSLLETILKVMDSLELSTSSKDELLSDVNTTEIQLRSPKPKREIINASLLSIKSIMEGAAGSELHSQMNKIIPNIITSIATFVATGVYIPPM